MFIGMAVLMWWPITSRMPELPRISYPAQMAYLFLLSLAQIIVFANITFSSEPLYKFYVDAPREVRLARLLDRRYPEMSWIDHWMAAEDWYVEHVHPTKQVALVVHS